MYAPPQPTLVVSQPASEEHHKLGAGLHNHLRHRHPEPFSYEYVFEEGKLPVLAEFHPKSRGHRATRTLPSQPQVQPSSAMHRSRSLNRTEKNLQFDVSSYRIPSPPQERTSDKLKRAFSLSGIRSSSKSRRAASKSHIKEAPPVPRQPSNHIKPQNSESRVPSLVLPTPSPSPEPIRNSFHSNRRAPINYSLPRSSWASYDDDFDLAFLRESTLGRLSPIPFPTAELRRDKAFAVLGITDMSLSPPFTPAPSTAPSVRDYHSRASSRRPSAETRRSQVISHLEEQKQLPDLPSATEQETWKPEQPKQQQALQAQELSRTTARPQILRRTTSKFIEHLDSPVEYFNFPHSQPSVVVTRPKLMVERCPTGPILCVPQPRSASPVRRSVSMRAPSQNSSSWGAVVCLAQARPVVAAGHARMIQS